MKVDVAEILGLGYGFALVFLPFTFFLSLKASALWLGYAVIVLFYVFQHRRGVKLKINWRFNEGYLVLLIVVVFSLLFVAYLDKHPSFPRLPSADFIQHPKLVRHLILGDVRIEPLYTSAHFAYASLVNPSNIIMSYHQTSTWFAALSPLIIYLSASKMSSRLLGVLAVAVYAFTSPLWYHFIFSAGLMPNFYSLMLSLFAIYLVQGLQTVSAKSTLLVPLGLILFTSHPSGILVLPPLVIYGLISRSKTVLAHVGLLAIPLTLIAPVVAKYVPDAARMVTEEGHRFLFLPMFFTNLFDKPSMMFLRILSAQLQTDALTAFMLVGLLGVVAMAGVGVARCIKTGIGGMVSGARNSPLTPYLCWFLVLAALSTVYPNLGWRAVYPALAPLTILAPVGVLFLARPVWSRIGYVRIYRFRKKVVRRWEPSLMLKLIPAFIVSLFLVYNGHYWNMMNDSTYYPSFNHAKELAILQAVNALGGMQASTYFAVEEWRFEFLGVYDRQFTYYQAGDFPTKVLLDEVYKKAFEGKSRVISSTALDVTSVGRLFETGSLGGDLRKTGKWSVFFDNELVVVLEPVLSR